MTRPRFLLVDPSGMGFFLCVYRCVLRGLLCGRELAEILATDLHAYAGRFIHLHVVNCSTSPDPRSAPASGRPRSHLRLEREDVETPPPAWDGKVQRYGVVFHRLAG